MRRGISTNTSAEGGDDEDVPLAAYIFESIPTTVSQDTSEPKDGATFGFPSTASLRTASSSLAACSLPEVPITAPTAHIEPDLTTITPVGLSQRLTTSTASVRIYPLLSSTESCTCATHSSNAEFSSLKRERQQRRLLAQTTLDFGQRGSDHIGQRCPQCNMLFNAHTEDATVHRRYCRAQQRREWRKKLTSRDGYATYNSYCKDKAAAAGEGSSTPPSFSTSAKKDSLRRIGNRYITEEVRRGGEAVSLLETLLGAPIETPPNGNTRHGLDTCRAKRAAKPGSGSSTFKRRTRERLEQTCSLAGSTRATTGRFSPLTCLRFPLVVNGPASLASLHPLEVVVAKYICEEKNCGDFFTSANGRNRALLQLVDLLGFTDQVFSFPQMQAEAHSSGNVNSDRDGEQTTTFVFVVDTALRQLLCAVVGHAHQREQDPELCVRQRADGSTFCSTRRHFTYGDVTDLWLLSSAGLSAAQRAWEDRVIAPHLSTQNVLQRFFEAATASRESTEGGSNHDSTISTSSSELSKKKSECVVQQQEQHQEKLAAGVALYTLARHLSYGHVLSPFTQLSYAQSFLKKRAKSENSTHCPLDFMGSSGAFTGGDTEGDFSHDGDNWLVDCLRTASPLLTESGSNASLKVETMSDETDAVVLFFHNDEDESGCECSGNEEGDCDGLRSDDSDNALEECALRIRKERHESLSLPALQVEESADSDGGRLSVVSLSLNS